MKKCSIIYLSVLFYVFHIQYSQENPSFYFLSRESAKNKEIMVKDIKVSVVIKIRKTIDLFDLLPFGGKF